MLVASRRHFVAFIRDVLDRTSPKAARDLPIVVLSGTNGAGKTTILTHIESVCHGGRPTSLVRTTDSDNTRTILRGIAFQLSREVGHFGSMEFPRFALGRLIIESAHLAADEGELADPSERKEVKKAIVKIVNGTDAALRNALLEIGDDILGILGVDTQTTSAIRLAFRASFPLRRAIAAIRNVGLDWYRASLGESDAYEALLELKRLSRSADHREQEKADRQLCQAFLMDLQAAFSGRHRRTRTGNCIAIVDSTAAYHDDIVEAFLASYATAKNTNRSAGMTVDDPLALVVSSRRRARRLGAVRSTAVELASYSDWRIGHDNAHNDQAGSKWLYQVEMSDLNSDELDELLGGSRKQDAITRNCAQRVAHSPWPIDRRSWSILTLEQGQIGPRSISLAHPTIFLLAHQALQSNDWNRVLAKPIEANSHSSVATRILDQLLGSSDYELRQNLVTFSCCFDLSNEYRHDVPGLLSSVAFDKFCTSDQSMWVDNSSGQPSLHPALRRLLQVELSVRPSTHPRGWRNTNEILASYHNAQRRETDAMYHWLACGEVARVSTFLASQFNMIPQRDWVSTLLRIASAPQVVGAVPQQQSRAQTPLDEAYPFIRKILEMMWISNDSIGDPQLALDTEIAGELDSLALRVEDSSDRRHLRDLAALYRSRRQEYVTVPQMIP